VTLEVHVDHGVPLGFGHVDDHTVAQDAGVVDEHVQIAERIDGLLHHALRTVPIGDVVAVDDGLATHRLDLVDDLHGGTEVAALAVHVAAEVVDDDLGAFSREQQRVCAAQAARRAGDDRDASVERTHGWPSFSKCRGWRK
jgi:hypothetical protein